MKTRTPILKRTALALVLACVGVAASGVKPGDDEATVRAELGAPIGQYKIGDRTMMTFERGDVEFVGGKVVRSELVSAEEAKQRRERREREAAEAAERARIAKEKRIAEGTDIYQRKLNDPSFMNAPAAERVAFWNGFKAKYPEVPLGPEYQQAVNEHSLELQAQSAAAAQARAAAAPAQTYVEPTSTYYNRSYWRDGGAIIVNPDQPTHLPSVREPGPYVTPIESTAGYGFQRATSTPTTTRTTETRPTPRPTPRSAGRR